jgi:PAS domain S-box-containing protein
MVAGAPWQEVVASSEVKAFLASPRTGVYVVDAAGNILWASPSMREVVGRAPEELVGRNAWDLIVPKEDLPEVARFRAALSQGDGVIWMRLVMPDGGRSWFQVDTRVRQGLILCAFRREPDAGQRVRFDIYPRRA